MNGFAGLNNFDLVVVGVILLSGLLALMRGFVRELLSLITWTGSFFIAAKYYPLAEPWTRRYIHDNPSVAADVAAVVIFVLAFIVLAILSAIISSLVRGRAITSIDRSLGFIFGLLRGALIVCIAYMVAATLVPDIDDPDAKPAEVVIEHTKTETISGEITVREKDSKHELKSPVPDWLITAKTRPYLSSGAAELRGLIPQGALEKHMQLLDEKGAAAKHLIDQQRLDNLSVPSILGGKEKDKDQGYDTQNRSKLNNLIDEKGK